MSQIISAISQSVTAALTVTPTDKRDQRYFKALNAVASAEFVKAGFHPQNWGDTGWKPEDTHNKYWVSTLISLTGIQHYGTISMLFSDGDTGYILAGYLIEIRHFDDDHKPTTIFSQEYIKDLANSKALIGSAVSDFRLALKKAKLEALFELESVELYNDFRTILARLAAGRVSQDWIPGIKASFGILQGSTNCEWRCNVDATDSRTWVAQQFQIMASKGSVDIDLSYTTTDKIINPKSLAATALEIFDGLKQGEGNSLKLKLAAAKFAGSKLDVTFRISK